MSTRADLAERSVALARVSPRMPTFAADASREDLLRWLESNDRNGCYSDADNRAEGHDPIDLEAAWDLVADALEEC